MYEDGEITFVEVPEEEYNLFDTTLACAACHWVAYEVYKVREKDIKQYGTFPGAAFFLSNLKTTTGGIFVNIHPVSETRVRVDCIHADPQEITLSPEDAVEFILAL